ncbi:MAG: hypothetical protein AB8B71_16690 [Paracoccaceae bacterium]
MRKFAPLTALLCAAPTLSSASNCAETHPDWTGTPVTALQELIALAASPASLILLAITLIAVRFRSQIGGLIAVILWSGLVALITYYDPSGTRTLARVEGCVGSPALFIAAVTAICVGIALYTAPLEKRPN